MHSYIHSCQGRRCRKSSLTTTTWITWDRSRMLSTSRMMNLKGMQVHRQMKISTLKFCLQMSWSVRLISNLLCQRPRCNMLPQRSRKQWDLCSMSASRARSKQNTIKRLVSCIRDWIRKPRKIPLSYCSTIWQHPLLLKMLNTRNLMAISMRWILQSRDKIHWTMLRGKSNCRIKSLMVQNRLNKISMQKLRTKWPLFHSLRLLQFCQRLHAPQKQSRTDLTQVMSRKPERSKIRQDQTRPNKNTTNFTLKMPRKLWTCL